MLDEYTFHPLASSVRELTLRADIAAGRGVGLLDPHGDLAEQMLAAIPKARTNDVVVFDPSDEYYAIGFNPLACFDSSKHDLVADDVLSAFASIYDLSQTPRLKDTLRNALYVLIEQGETLVGLLLLLSDPAYRSRLVANVSDDVARLFWQREFPSWNERNRTPAPWALGRGGSLLGGGGGGVVVRSDEVAAGVVEERASVGYSAWRMKYGRARRWVVDRGSSGPVLARAGCG
jgi:hypothetical protein